MPLQLKTDIFHRIYNKENIATEPKAFILLFVLAIFYGTVAPVREYEEK